MKKFIVVIVSLLCFTSLYSQKEITVLAKGETSLEGALPSDMLYLFPHFRQALLVNRDGSENQTRINFNLFTGDILFLTSANQILVIAYPEELDKIVIDDSVWLPVEGFFGEVLKSTGSVSLLRYKSTRITDTRRESGFGSMSSTTSSRSVTAFTSDSRGNVALPVGEYDFQSSENYRLQKGKRSIFANAKGYLKAFPDKKKQIREYLSENEIDFTLEEDHIRLFNRIQEM